MATDLFLEMAELPATGSLGTGQLDTHDLLVAGVPISISSKYLYLYLELSGSTCGGEADAAACADECEGGDCKLQTDLSTDGRS